jgi:hypothetical protein
VSLPRSSLLKPKAPENASRLEVATTMPAMPAIDPDATANDAGPAFSSLRLVAAKDPSAGELVERAAALGPVRMTWESIVLPNDPILDEKRQPHVAERRARLTRMVKVTLGACLAVCVVALGMSAVSGGSTSNASASSSTAPAVGKTAPSKGATPIETIDGSKRAKAARRVIPAATTATAAVGVRRSKHR